MPRKLLDAPSLGRGLPEPHLVHLADDTQSSIVIQRELGLVEQSVGTRAAGLTRGVHADAAFTAPHEQCSGTRGQCHSGMGHAGTRFEHQAGDRTHGDVHADAGFIDQNKRTILDVKLAHTEKEHGTTFFDGDGA